MAALSTPRSGGGPEIESFNLADLDVGALDIRLELTSLIPACTLILCAGNLGSCTGNCGTQCGAYCHSNGSGCDVHS